MKATIFAIADVVRVRVIVILIAVTIVVFILTDKHVL
jgi:hypothetical protein